MKNIPKTTKKAQKFPMLAGNILISVAQIFYAGCEVTFYHDKVTVTKGIKDIVEGYRYAKTTLWRMPITTPKAQKAHTKYHMSTPIVKINSVMPEVNMEKVMTYLQKALGSPKKSTLLRAVENNNLPTCTSLRTRNITKYLPKLVETSLGHLDQEGKTQQSIKSIIQKNYKRHRL